MEEDRRQFVKLIGIGIGCGLAGCSSINNNDNTELRLLEPDDLPGEGWSENDQEMFSGQKEQSYEWVQDDESVIATSGIATYGDVDEAAQFLSESEEEFTSSEHLVDFRSLGLADEGFGGYFEGVNGNQYEARGFTRRNNEVGAVRLITWDRISDTVPVEISINQTQSLATKMLNGR